jgi:hypothetical protein
MNKSSFISFIESPRKLIIVDFLIIFPFLILPLLINLPYRVNIFLTWEGAYRLYLGQTPFADFGLPMGFGFWLIPTLFFKLFGPTFLSLIKAQIVINLISLISLRGLLHNLKIKPLAVTLALLIFCLTYVIYNFWPWYNHSVVVFELVSLFFLTSYQSGKSKKANVINLSLSGVFTFITFYTKQDVGGLCFLICIFLVGYNSILERKKSLLIIYTLSFVITGALFILPFLSSNFLYWFNLGQAPHSSRISIGLLLDIFLTDSLLEKVYLLSILGSLFLGVFRWKDFIQNKNLFTLTVISVALILQSLVIRATSPLPTDHMNYFHTFAFIGIASFLPWEAWIKNLIIVPFLFIFIGLTFSEGYWKYVSGLFVNNPNAPQSEQIQLEPWVEGALPTMNKILLPPKTNEGITKLMTLPFLDKKDLRVLNMSELTSLAHEIGYTPLTHQPLWYHLNIGIFQKQVDEINLKVNDGYYDLVLFERVPSLNNFYPYEVLDELKKKYILIDSFLAPRKLEDSHIDVFVNPDLVIQYGLKAHDPTVDDHK